MTRVIAGALVALLVLSTTLAVCRSQVEEKSGDPQDHTDPLREFSVAKSSDINLVVRAREKAIRECVERLARQRRIEPQKVMNGSGPELFLLGELRAKDSESIDALCADLTREAGIVMASDDAWDPLLVFPAARSLVEIGGREAAEGILRRMKRKLDRRELLVCAHVLNQIDYKSVTLERLRLARKRVEAADSADMNRVFLGNLTQVTEWLRDPDFESDKELRP